MWPLAALVGAGAVLAYGARSRSSTLFAPSVFRGDRSRRVLALTFDDGPSAGTPEMLRVLAEFQVRATFFMCGANVRRRPDVAREVAAAGHEIGNHSDTHALFALRPPDFIGDQIARAQTTIREVTGVTPVLFRAPYGVRWFGLRAAQERFRLTGVMWTVLALDWKLHAPLVARRITAGASKGGIICLHDGRELDTEADISNTLDAVRHAVPILLERGYRFETVSELICPRNSLNESSE